jgi:NAD(P)-dependent dehydrogenase (short-subunit alcohol dehydrogenase family)
VYGGARRIPPGGVVVKPSTGDGLLRTFPLDVGQSASVSEFVSRVIDAEGGIGTLIHAAGYALAGAVEDITSEEAVAQFQANFFGAHRLYRAVLPAMRCQGYGRIIAIGSVAGLFPLPFQSMYSASKYALEALTEATRMEAAPFGIEVTIVDPGDIRTGFTAARKWAVAAQGGSAYQERSRRAVAAMVRSEQQAPGPEIVIREIDRLLARDRSPVRVVVGGQYKLICFIRKFLPDRLVHRILQRLYA